MKKLVVAIDGPAGAGKTTIAKELSKRLNIPFFSTGALYRAYALKCVQCGLDATDVQSAKQIALTTQLDVKYIDGNQHVILDGVDVTDKLHGDKISDVASLISAHKVIREHLENLQRNLASTQSIIMDGRDIGSVVLPQADFKFFLDADVHVRAERRYNELLQKGENVTYQNVLQELQERDYRDKTRKISPLVQCKDAIKIDCSSLTIEQVVEKFVEVIQSKDIKE